MLQVSGRASKQRTHSTFLLSECRQCRSSLAQNFNKPADDLPSAVKESIHGIALAVDPFSRCRIESSGNVVCLTSQRCVESDSDAIAVVRDGLPVGDETATAANVVENSDTPVTDVAAALRILDAPKVGDGTVLGDTLSWRCVALLD